MIKIIIVICVASVTTAMLSILGTTNIVNINISSSNEWMITFYVNTDQTSTSFMMTIATIALAVTMFSIFYIEEENNNNEFNILTALFVSSMIIIVLSPNLVSVMLGWDGLGISSFCLVMFYQNQMSLASSLVTIYSNRLGDIAILFLISSVNEEEWSNNQSIAITNGCLTAAAITNSAQVPFSAWLPAAIAAPTPTSSLVHSSTLVTAGVWVINRFTLTTNAEIINKVLMISAVTTTILAGITALNEKDINNMVAISTLSQLGIIMIISAIMINKIAIIHTITHALFNAILFMSVGSMIENNEGSQNNKLLSGQESNTSMTTMNTSVITLMSLPITSSFLSKDLILETLIVNTNISEVMALLTTAILTIKYSITIINEISSNNNSSESTEGKANNGEITLSTVITTTSLIIVIITETTINIISSTEKIAWIAILTIAIKNESNSNSTTENWETIGSTSNVTINEVTNKKNSNTTSDNNWFNSTFNITSEKILNLNNENNNLLNEAMAITIMIIIVTMN